MTIKRQLLNINQKSVDVRTGPGVFEELPRIVAAAVGMPKRALFVVREGDLPEHAVEVRRALVDAGFSVAEHLLPAGDGSAPRFSLVGDVLGGCASAGLTADDLVIALGDASVCTLACYAALLWCGGASCTLIPTTLDAMLTLATEPMPLDVEGGAAMVSMRPAPTMMLCDLDLIPPMGADERLLGRVLMVGAALAEGRRAWDRLVDLAPRVAADDPLALGEMMNATQLARRNVVKAANPSARHALEYGRATARALAACLGPGVPEWALRAEGMRFEARLAVEAARLDPEVVFDQDDLFEELGIEEVGFSLEAAELAASIKREHARRSNRFLLPLPKSVGSIRLAAVPDDILLRHASAYAASRAELAG